MASVTLTVGQSVPFKIAYLPAGSDSSDVTLATDNPAVCTLSGVSPDATAGTVVSVAAGTCNLVAGSPRGPVPLTGGDILVNAAVVHPTSGAVTFGTPA